MGWTSFYVIIDSASLSYEQKNTRNEAFFFLWKFPEIVLPFFSIFKHFLICCCWGHQGRRILYKTQLWSQLLATICKRVKEVNNSRCIILIWLWTALDTEYFLLKCSGPLEIQVIYRDASTEDANKTHKFKKKCKVLLWSSYKSVFVCQPYFRMLPFRWFLFLLISIKPFWHKADF